MARGMPDTSYHRENGRELDATDLPIDENVRGVEFTTSVFVDGVRHADLPAPGGEDRRK